MPTFRPPALAPAALAACLALSASGARSAQAAPTPPAAAQPAAPARTVPLQHTLPAEVIKTLHWDTPAGLPSGVTRVTALPAANALAVVATPGGLAQVREIVRLVDVAPRQVRVEFTLAGVTNAELKAAGVRLLGGGTGTAPAPVAAPLLRSLRARGLTRASMTLTTTNNLPASLTHAGVPLAPGLTSLTYTVTPRVNGGGDVTLTLRAQAVGKAAAEDLETTRTVRSGDSLVFTSLFARAAGARLVLFVTPTVVSK